MTTDNDLTTRMLAGDAAAFDTLFDRYEPQVRRRLVRVVRDESTADDLLQEVFLRLWTRAEQWEGRGSRLGWLLRMATNLALNQLRTVRRRRQQPLEYSAGPDRPLDDGDDDEDLVPGWMIDNASFRPDQIFERTEQHEALWGLVDSLPDRQREVLRMAHEMEMDISEIADQLGIPPGTVKSRLHYARSGLAKELKQRTEEQEDS